jgi:bifunctional non-homologous end joining protein LigD
MSTKLPEFIAPMLATPAEPFDSDDYLFEIKWDGIRTLAFIEDGAYRLINRRRLLMTERYPEFAFLKDLPSGTVLDGEMIVFKNGKPDFPYLMSREQARTARRIGPLSRLMPANYVVFDLLYDNGKACMNRPLPERRERLERVVEAAGKSLLVLSQGIIGKGERYFAEAVKRDLEGVVAKRLDSRYLPGQRNDCWLKIKRQSEILCAIIGFVPSGADDFQSLIIAAEEEGELRCVGRVGSGFNNAARKQLNQLLWSRLQRKPCVPCKFKGKWITPGLYCHVRFMEQTDNGDLRAPAFKGLVIRDTEPNTPPAPPAEIPATDTVDAPSVTVERVTVERATAESAMAETPSAETPLPGASAADVSIAESSPLEVQDPPTTEADTPGLDALKEPLKGCKNTAQGNALGTTD